MTSVLRRSLALARSSSRPVGRLINGRMSGAPDGMSIHTDDQAAILYKYSRMTEIPYAHVQGGIQMHASQIEINILRTYGCSHLEKQRCWLVCQHTPVLNLGHTLPDQSTLRIQILGRLHRRKILKGIS